MTNQEKMVYNIIGLAIRANKVIYGMRLLQLIKTQKVFLVLSSCQIGLTQKKMFLQKCFFYNIDYYSELSPLIFEKLFCNLNVKTIGIVDKNLAQKIYKEIKNNL